MTFEQLKEVAELFKIRIEKQDGCPEYQYYFSLPDPYEELQGYNFGYIDLDDNLVDVERVWYWD